MKNLAFLRSELSNRVKLSLDNNRADYFLNKGQNRVAKKVALSHLKDETTFSSVASTQRYYLSSDILKVLAIYDTTNDKKLIELTDTNFDDIDPDRGSTGTPFAFKQWAPTEFSAVMPSSSVVSMVSSSASDVTQTVIINGVVNGVNDSESKTLSGTTLVSTTKTFSSVFGIRKSASTLGKVTVTAGATTLTDIAPADIANQYQPVDLINIPTDVVEYRVKYIRVPRKMVGVEDIPDLPELYEDLVLLGAEIEARDDLQDFARSKELREIFEFELKDIKANQGSNRGKRRFWGRKKKIGFSRRGPNWPPDFFIE